MYKLAVMGDRESIFGYTSLGIELFPVKETDEAKKLLRSIIDKNYAVIYMTEELAERLSDEIDRYKDLVTPAIIPIPGLFGNTGAGIKNVKKSVERALGSDIIF